MSSGAPRSTTQTVEPNSLVRPHLNNLFNAASQRFNQGGPEFFPGSTLAETSHETGVGRDLATGAVANIQGINHGTQSVLEDLATSDITKTPHFQSAMDAAINPVMRNFKETILPAINDGASSSGAFGGARHQILKNQAGLDVADRIGDISSRFAFNALQEGNRNRQFAVSAVPQLIQNTLTPAQVFSGVGAQIDNESQAQIDADRERFEFNERRPDFAINNFANILNGVPGATSTTRNSGGNSGLLTAAGLAALFGGGLF